MKRFNLLFAALAVLLSAACSGSTEDNTPTSLATESLLTQAPLTTTQPVEPTASLTTIPPTPTTEATSTLAPTSTPASPNVSQFPDPQNYAWVPVFDGLQAPVGLESPEDQTGRLFIVEQPGRIKVVVDGTIQEQPFLNISDQVSSGGERGLLGLAFHPDFSENGFFYVNYTNLEGNTHISRFTVSAENPNQADPSSEEVLVFAEQPFPNHNGGVLAFGPDGYLYIGLGDGGSAGDPMNNAQSPNTILGKILRIDVNQGTPYAIPPDNPFVEIPGASQEIWAYGLRNPWRFTFDRLTGSMFIADVGQNQWEEINYLPPGSPGGANFGWNYFEGLQIFQGNTPPEGLDPVMPVAVYGHDQGCSVTGGVVYRGSLPEWQGVYLYGDYCSGIVWGLLQDDAGAWTSTPLFQNTGRITSFGEDDQGEVYLLDHSGTIYLLSEK